ncbi:GNAT family N-acetyltransferase [Nakamurella sp. GG22]
MTQQVPVRTARELLIGAATTASATADRAGITVRPLETLEQMTAACALLGRVWGIGPGQAFDLQPHLLRALGHGGNYLVGAYRTADDRLVGASAAFFTEPLGAAMHSHITGVIPGDAGRGVGAALKWHQRQWALERGLTRITWTFDPLIARNCFFNITRLGARPETYFVDFYGAMEDAFNKGQPSDRIEVVWHLGSATTLDAESVARQGAVGSDPVIGPHVPGARAGGAAVLLSVGPDGGPAAGRGPGDVETALIGIPADIERVRRTEPGLALRWRYELRAALAFLMADRCWTVTGFTRDGWYLLERTPPGDVRRS